MRIEFRHGTHEWLTDLQQKKKTFKIDETYDSIFRWLVACTANVMNWMDRIQNNKCLCDSVQQNALNCFVCCCCCFSFFVCSFLYYFFTSLRCQLRYNCWYSFSTRKNNWHILFSNRNLAKKQLIWMLVVHVASTHRW